jgi:hypothetical protein
MNNSEDKNNLYLDLLINSKKKSQKDNDKKPNIVNVYSIKLHKHLAKLDPHILQNEIILSNFDDFLIYLDSVIKKSVYAFCKQITYKID